MHDIAFSHVHMSPEEREQLSEVIWNADNVQLTTVGVDIGSSTSHLMFARVHMQRLSTALSSRFVVVNREILWRSPIYLTPYRSDLTIDAENLESFVNECYTKAGLSHDEIDSGAVILTGEALKRANARAIADVFAKETGKFVCASAGHHMESAMAANGSGTVKLSRNKKNVILNVDIGGGTTKLALIKHGELVSTAAFAVGGRLIVQNDEGVITRLEEPAVQLAESLGISLSLGVAFGREDRNLILQAMTKIMISMIRQEPIKGIAQSLMVTEPLAGNLKPDAITFSGGIAEFLFGREKNTFSDLGAELAHRLSHALAEAVVDTPIWDPGQGIRATVVGASQFSVQVSGNTIHVSNHTTLPLRNIPVLTCRFDLTEDEIDPQAITDEVQQALTTHDLVDDGETVVAISFAWQGDPLHVRLHTVAQGIAQALPKCVAANGPLVLMVDGDIGKTLGRIFINEVSPGCDVVAIDGVQLKDFDYVDVGEVITPTNVVPVIIKSLLF